MWLRTATCALAVLMVLILGSRPAEALRLLGITVNGELIEIDPTNGSSVLLANTGLQTVESLEMGPDGQLRAIARSDTSAADTLYRIDPADPTNPQLLGKTGFLEVEAMALDIDGITLHAAAGDDVVEFAAERLVRLDPVLGTGSDVGAFGSPVLDVDGLAMSPAGVLYGYDLDGHFVAGGCQFVEIDTGDGSASVIQNYGTCSGLSVFALEFRDSDGTLFATTHPGNTGGAATLITIDPATGAMSTRGAVASGSTHFSSVTGLVFVPEPGTAGFFALGLLGFGLRRRWAAGAPVG